MHYRLVAKTADFTPEELLEKLQGFMPVADEAVHQYGCWKLARYADFAAFAADEGIDTDEARTVDEQDGILRQHGFALGDDHKIYEKYQPILTALSSKASDAIKMSLPTRAVFMPLFPRPEIFIT